MENNETIFGKILRGEIPCKKVLENDEFLAFHDIAPKAEIHVLAIPKKLYRDFNDLPSDVMAKMSEFIKEVAEVLNIDKSGYRLITNIGLDGGQEVPHIHFHILGGCQLKWPDLRAE